MIVAFALFGRTILNYLGVGLPALEGAGGLLLLLVSLELLTGKSDEPTSAQRATANVAFVPLGTPLLAGPGAIVPARSLTGYPLRGPQQATLPTRYRSRYGDPLKPSGKYCPEFCR